MKSDGWGGRDRTSECRNQNPPLTATVQRLLRAKLSNRAQIINNLWPVCLTLAALLIMTALAIAALFSKRARQTLHDWWHSTDSEPDDWQM